MTKSITKTWARIVKHKGEEFRTKRALPFTYRIWEDAFFSSRTGKKMSKADFERVLEHVPFDKPGYVKNQTRGASYVWAVLHDPRIRSGDLEMDRRGS